MEKYPVLVKYFLLFTTQKNLVSVSLIVEKKIEDTSFIFKIMVNVGFFVFSKNLGCTNYC